MSKNKSSSTNASKSSRSYKPLLITSSLICLGAYYVYVKAMVAPEMPIPDLNQYWGPYPIELEAETSIRPFIIEFSDAIVNDLRDRLLHHRKPPLPLEDVGFTYGFNSNFLTQLVDYWHNKYNFKERESILNQYKHYKTKIQGLDIHFMHVKPQVSEDIEVVPLLLLHGWPGSFREFYEMIPALIKPRVGRNFVFEVIVPSLPGFGFSEGPARPGHGPFEMAVVMRNLMQRLGHDKYYVQGGDFGHAVGSIMATLFQDNVLGFHTNLPAVIFNPMANVWIFIGSFWPSFLDTPEMHDRMYPIGENLAHKLLESGYMHIQATKPDTVGAALTDSPAGLAAYILEKFSTWTNPEYRQAYDGNLLKKFSLTHLLDNVMIYWASGCITTSMRAYAETMNTKSLTIMMDRIPTEVPTWGIKFKHELIYHPDSILRMKYKNYLQSTIVNDGGHFAAMENPDILSNDVFEAVGTFRKFHGKANLKDLPKTVYGFTVNDINGNEIKLDKYKGFVLLIVNVASQCGLSNRNYQELNILHKNYYNKGLRILAFPCNQFNGQEPGSPRDILTFTKNKGVEFDLFEKIDVNGEKAHALWKYLKTVLSGTMADYIKWNFSKFIVDRNGVPVERLGPNVNPLDLEPYLVKYL